MSQTAKRAMDVNSRGSGWWMVAVLTIALAGCGGGEGNSSDAGSSASAALTAPDAPVQSGGDVNERSGEESAPVSPTVAGNAAPKISGKPLTALNVGSAYSFQPVASD